MSCGIVDFAKKAGDTSNKLYAMKNCRCTDANLKEALLLKKLDHPNIVKIYDAFILERENRDDRLYIVMELANGKKSNSNNYIYRRLGRGNQRKT